VVQPHLGLPRYPLDLFRQAVLPQFAPTRGRWR
jgi:hypothetical protein